MSDNPGNEPLPADDAEPTGAEVADTAMTRNADEQVPVGATDSDVPVTSETPSQQRKQSIWTRNAMMKAAAIAAAVALVLGAVGGGIVGYLSRPAVPTTAEYQSMKRHLTQELSDVKSELGIAQNNLDAANQHISDIKDRESALAAGEAKLQADQKALDQRTQQVQSSQFSDGVHVVGVNVTPGVYSINNGTNCYYAWMTSTGSDADIIDNNIVSGPATVTLKQGDIFETNRCGSWTKVG